MSFFKCKKQTLLLLCHIWIVFFVYLGGSENEMYAAWKIWKNIRFEGGDTNGKLMERCHTQQLYALWVFYWSVYGGIIWRKKDGLGDVTFNYIKNVYRYQLVVFYHITYSNREIYISYRAIIVPLCEAVLSDYWYMCLETAQNVPWPY